MIPGKFKYTNIYQKILSIVFVVANSIFLITNVVDFVYFKFTSKRSTFSLITASGMQGDLPRLIPVFLKDYWYLFVLGALLVSLLYFLNSKLRVQFYSEKPAKFSIYPFLLFFVSIGLIILIGRGGMQRAPIKTVDAIKYTENPVYTAVVLNTPFTIIKTLSKKDNLREVHFYDEKDLNKIYQPIIHMTHEKPFHKKNVVLLILESFGKENLHLRFDGEELTPFLDSLFTQGLYYENSFANGRKSIDAVPSTITSIPCLMEVSYISSPYSFNKIQGFNYELKKKNYHTAFFHGSFNGSQNFNQFAPLAGFDAYYGKNEYDRKGGEDGTWGIFDEEFLQFSVRKINTFKPPFFATIFTISSHVPFTIPEKYKNRFPKGNRSIHESIAYADFSLKNFFETAKKQSWYKETLFVITADHSSGDDKTDPYFTNAIGNYKVPIFFFSPDSEILPEVNSKLIQQIDIYPEVLNFLSYDGKFFSFGNDPNRKNHRIVANYNEGLYHFIVDEYYICFDGKKIVKVSNYLQDPLLEKNLKLDTTEFEKLIKAYIQQYNNRVIQNQLYLEEH